MVFCWYSPPDGLPGFDRVPGSPLVVQELDSALRVVAIHDGAVAGNQPFDRRCLGEQLQPLRFGVLGCRAGCPAVVVRPDALHAAKSADAVDRRRQRLEELLRPFPIPLVGTAGDGFHIRRAGIVVHERPVPCESFGVGGRADAAAAVPVLVADAPEPHVERLLGSIGAALVGQCGVPGEVAVLYPVASLLRRGGAEVGGEVRLRANGAAESDELVGAEVVWLLGHAPVDVHAPWPPLRRADAVMPVIVVREAAAGPAQDGYFQWPQRLDNVRFGDRRRSGSGYLRRQRCPDRSARPDARRNGRAGKAE